MNKLGTLAFCTVVGALIGNAAAQLPSVPLGPLSVEVQSVATGLSSPLDVVTANDGTGRLFIIEQVGRIRLLKNGSLDATPFLDITTVIKASGEQGLLGLAFHPGFSNSASPGFRKLYTFENEMPTGLADFTVPMSGTYANRIVIVEWQVSASNPDLVDPATRREVLRIAHPQENHNGGKIAFRPSDGYLYIAIGDGGNGNDVGDGHTPNLGNGQDTSNLLGKILRIDPLQPALTPGSTNPLSTNGRYRIPADNPFVNGGGLREIYAYGFRNPYRFSFDPTADRLVVGDVGQNAIEEVDVVERGKNYGWNRKEGSFLFNPANAAVTADPNPDPAFVNPVLEYDHGDGVSVIGGLVYRGSVLTALTGKYIFGDFLYPRTGNGRLFVGDLSAHTIEELRLGINSRTFGLRIKGFGSDAAGEIYILADNANSTAGQVLKIVPIPVTPELLNLSTRARVETDDNGFAIAGFIITGSAPKTVVIRARGPSLANNNQPLPGRLLDPTLALQTGNNVALDSNDDWMLHPRAQELINFQLAPTDSREAALVATLQPGAYTALMRGAGGSTGIGLVEVFDVQQSAAANAVNLSTRGRVQTGDDAMITGLIVGGTQSQRVMIRVLGPTLTDRGVAGALQNPTLELVDSSGNRLAFNDDWRSDQATEIAATGLAPTKDAESAIVRTLAPGAYTAIVRGAGDTTGIGLVETFRLAP